MYQILRMLCFCECMHVICWSLISKLENCEFSCIRWGRALDPHLPMPGAGAVEASALHILNQYVIRYHRPLCKRIPRYAWLYAFMECYRSRKLWWLCFATTRPSNVVLLCWEAQNLRKIRGSWREIKRLARLTGTIVQRHTRIGRS